MKGSQTIDRRYGRAGIVVEPDSGREPRTPFYDKGRSYKSRAGFSATRSRFINQGIQNEPEYDEFDRAFMEAQPLHSQSEARYTDTNGDFTTPSRSSSKYIRKSGFGKTINNMDYGAKLTYVPFNSVGRYKKSELYTARPTEETKNYYTRTKYSSRPSGYSKSSAYTSSQEVNGSTLNTPARFLNKGKLTDEEYQLFKDFSTPIKYRKSTVSNY